MTLPNVKDLLLAERIARISGMAIFEHPSVEACYASHYFAFPERSGVTLRPEESRIGQDQPDRFLS